MRTTVETFLTIPLNAGYPQPRIRDYVRYSSPSQDKFYCNQEKSSPACKNDQITSLDTIGQTSLSSGFSGQLSL